ncbi:MAG TPA: calcium-binding protein [Dehalococcoidia bacterium]|nr:calcium-binding protein [Dehalococcoidia bacterium]
MFVLVPWERRTLAVPLSQLEVITGDESTRRAIEDWHYWIARGYEL